MKKAHKKWACDYKNLQRLGEEALCGSRPKILRIPKSLSCVDEVSAAGIGLLTSLLSGCSPAATLSHRNPSVFYKSQKTGP